MHRTANHGVSDKGQIRPWDSMIVIKLDGELQSVSFAVGRMPKHLCDMLLKHD